MTVPAVIAHGVQQVQEWLQDLMVSADLRDEKEAWAVLRAVLHQLRDRMMVAEAVQLSAQLPIIVRGVYFEGWQPARTPNKSIHSRQDFLDGVADRLHPHSLPAGEVTEAVFALLVHHLDPGEISDVIGQLPDDIKSLWPLTARTYKERTR